MVTVNTKVDMRFNINDAYWLSDRIRERIMQMVSYFFASVLSNAMIKEMCQDKKVAMFEPLA